jgi:hypothetical protein
MARKDPAPKIVAVVALLGALATAAPALAQQPDYQVPDYQTPTYQPPSQTPNQAPAEENAPGAGGGETPTAPGAGAGPGNAGGVPGGSLPRTGFADAIFIGVLGFVLLLAGTAIRRPLSRS